MKKKHGTASTIYRQIQKVNILGIIATLLLGLGTSLWYNLHQEGEMRDRALMNAAQLTAMTPVLAEGEDSAANHIKCIVHSIPDVDVLTIYDASGHPVSYYGLLSASSDPANAPPLGDSILRHFRTSRDTLLFDAEAPLGTEHCAYAAIYGDGGELHGFVMAGIYMRSIHRMVMTTLLQHFIIAAVMLILGSLLSMRLAIRIKTKLLGYEPDAFRNLFIQRMDILEALEEGILAINTQGRVIYINKAAAGMLSIDRQTAPGRPLQEVYPCSTMARVMETGEPEYNVSLVSFKHVHILSDRVPMRRDGHIEGAVAIFRNRTEVTQLAQDLTGVQHIVEALRAYTHEFMNKLHVLLGLLQLGEIKQAEDYILQITRARALSIGFINEHIAEPSIAALLIGKSCHAAEQGIRLTLDPMSRLQSGDRYLPASGLVTVLGNLIENAFDAFRAAPSSMPHEITVSIREGAHGLLISVDDNGPGILPDVAAHMFDEGYSTKGYGRGTGLHLVKSILDAYHGSIRAESEPGVGTSFIIALQDTKES